MSLEKIEKLLENIQEDIIKIHTRIDTIDNKLLKSKNNINIKELKKNKIELNDSIIKKHLEKNSLVEDFEIIKEIYFNGSHVRFPISLSNNQLQYWLNNQWNRDNADDYIADVLIGNLNSCYLRYNKFEKYANNTDLYIKNQEYISLIYKDDKYKQRLLKYLKKYLENIMK